MKHVLSILLVLFCSLAIKAGDYTVKKGEKMTLRCTATAPAGWITHAFFDLVDKNDAKYIGITYNSSDCYATIYGLSGSPRIAIEVTYCYSYRGSYDNNIHVGHGTYRDYITVSGPQTATSFKFREGNDILIPPGGSTVVHVDFYPSGAEPNNFSCGVIDNFGRPYNFELKQVEGSSYDILVNAKNKPDTYAYMLAYINNDQTTSQTAKLTISDQPTELLPTKITLNYTDLTLFEGQTKNLSVSFIPGNSWAKPEFSSSNSQVATVDENGKITAVGKGTADITVTTSELKETCHVIVSTKATDFAITSQLSLAVGFSYIIDPKPIPSDSKATFRLSTSDTGIITIAGTEITGIRAGTATLNISCPESNTNRDITVTVTAQEDGVDHRAASQRVQIVKNLYYSVLRNK